jgi:Tfp pilus assembly protein PilV
MRLDLHPSQTRAGNRLRVAGMTLAEVLISMVIVAMMFTAIINGYLVAAKRAQWTGYSLAAQSLSVQCLERARSAVWDIAMNKNELTNMTLMAKAYDASTKTWSGYTTNILDVPWKGTNFLLATNFVSIQLIYQNNKTNVPVQMQMLRVDTVWAFNAWGNFSVRLYTNTTCTYLAPDNRGF